MKLLLILLVPLVIPIMHASAISCIEPVRYGNLQVDVLPPISNPECKNVTLLYDVKPDIEKKYDAKVEFQVLDKFTKLIPHSTIQLIIKNDYDVLFEDVFNSDYGRLIFYLQHDSKINGWKYVENPKDKLSDSGRSNNDAIYTIRTPSLDYGRFDVEIQLFTVYDDSYSFAPNERPTFAFQLLVDQNGNISEDRNNLLPTKQTSANVPQIDGGSAFKLIKSPLEQFKSGITLDKIQCRDSLVLILKHNNSPACVKPDTGKKLAERGWINYADYQNKITREVGYIGLYMISHYVDSDNITISIEGRPDFVKQIVDSYNIEIISNKKTPDDSFSSSFGQITRGNLYKFFGENPMNHFLGRGLAISAVGSFSDDSGTYGPFNDLLTEEEGQRVGKFLEEYEKKRKNLEHVEWEEIIQHTKISGDSNSESSSTFAFEFVLNQIVLNQGIDDYDSGTSFSPIYKKAILGKNNTIEWFNAKQEPVNILSDDNFFNATIMPQESFSFTYDSIGIHKYHDPTNWKRGTIFVSTENIESSNLHPAKLLEKNPDEIAKEIMQTAINDDSIIKTRLNNTIINAYTTKRGADIIVPESLCIMCTLSEFRPIEYRYGMTAPLYYPQSTEDAVDFAKRFMNGIGYKLDGTEWIDSVDFGSYVQVKIQQRVQGWIVPNQFVSFTFFKDHTTITIGRWYDDVSAYHFSLSQDDAKEIAKKYMEKEVDSNLALKGYKYKLESIGDAQVIISYDKPLYVIPVGFKSTLQQEFNNGHCGSPQYFGAMVMVEGKTGSVMGWDYPGCE